MTAHGGEFVELATGLGDVLLRIDSDHAPITAAHFLRLVERGAYNGGEFHRTVRPGNHSNSGMAASVVGRGLAGDPASYRMPDDSYPISIVQASARLEEITALPIPLERTRDTGLRHLAGVVSMSRQTPDSAVSDFFVCLRDEPELDFGGRRNPDGQGFAVFGRVVRGFSTVRRIHEASASGQSLDPVIPILTARIVGMAAQRNSDETRS